jgi:phosphoribosylaminoimidazole-succinocarboxamide synthase
LILCIKYDNILKDTNDILNRKVSFMETKGLLYEGTAKKVWKTNDPDLLIIEYKDDIVQKEENFDTGTMDNRITNYIFRILEEKGIPTHYVQELSDRETVVKKVSMLPLEVIVRNVSAGSFKERFGVEEGVELLCPVVEFRYKNEALKNPWMNAAIAEAMGIATKEELYKIIQYAGLINETLIEFFAEKEIRLIDFKIEFGKYKDQIILADEISPDTCRLWGANTNEKFDKKLLEIKYTHKQ